MTNIVSLHKRYNIAYKVMNLLHCSYFICLTQDQYLFFCTSLSVDASAKIKLLLEKESKIEGKKVNISIFFRIIFFNHKRKVKKTRKTTILFNKLSNKLAFILQSSAWILCFKVQTWKFQVFSLVGLLEIWTHLNYSQCRQCS